MSVRAGDWLARWTWRVEVAQIAVVIVWGSTFVVTKGAFSEVTPLAFVFVRFLAMTGLSFAVLAARAVAAPTAAAWWRIDRADWPRLVWAALLGFFVYQLAFFIGLDYTSPFSSALLISLIPLYTVIILLLTGENPSRQVWLGLAIAVVGVLLFLSEKVSDWGGLLGDGLTLLGGVCFAAYGLINRPLVAKYPPETASFYTVLIGTLPLLVVSAPAALAQNWGAVSIGSWLAIAYMTVFPIYIAYMIWNWAIQRRGAARATSLHLLVSVVSGVFSALFFGEAFGAIKVIGAAAVIVGLALARRG